MFQQSIRTVREPFPAADFERVCDDYGIVEKVRSKLAPGQYFSRMWREGECPHPRENGLLLVPWVSTVRYARILYARFRDVTGYIEPTRAHDAVHGHEIRQLLLLACTEVESAWRSILQLNWPACPDRLTTNQYVQLCAAMGLDEWEVRLSAHPTYGALSPFAGWDPQQPTESLRWYAAYNETKHSREGGLEDATFGHLVNALAAVFIMTIAQFGTEHLDGDSEFQVDEFCVVRSPRLGLDEMYIRPLAPPGSEDAGQWRFECCPDVQP